MSRLGTDLAHDLQGYAREWDALAKVLIRRLITQRGSLFYDRDFGMDVRLWINEGMTQQSLWELATLIEREMLKDERVGAAQVSITPRQGDTRIDIDITTAAAPYRLTVAVDAMRVERLRGGIDDDATRVARA